MFLLFFMLTVVNAYTQHVDDEKNLSFVSGLLIGVLIRHYLFKSVEKKVVTDTSRTPRSRSKRKSTRLKNNNIKTTVHNKIIQDSKSTV